MIVSCVDSSAVLRLCLGEGDLTFVEQAMVRAPTLSVLAHVEVPCAILARTLRGTISAEQRERALDIAARLLATSARVGLTGRVRQQTVAIAERHLVRSSDAVHLGTAVLTTRRQQPYGNEVRFCTADRRQAEVAEALLGAGRVDFVPPWR